MLEDAELIPQKRAALNTYDTFIFLKASIST
jgi:hypothetical protein